MFRLWEDQLRMLALGWGGDTGSSQVRLGWGTELVRLGWGGGNWDGQAVAGALGIGFLALGCGGGKGWSQVRLGFGH